MRNLKSEPTLNMAIRDLADGMRQQMFFWGRDAIHPDGNLFIHSGFKKRASTGLQGTSCYSLEWQGGVIELHGSHAGWIGQGGGFIFIRPLGRCVRWTSASLPVPGNWQADQYDTRADSILHELAIPFLNWWLAHEARVTEIAGPDFRTACFRQFKKLPKTRPWLAPHDATRWVTQLRDHPESVPRARRFSRSLTTTS